MTSLHPSKSESQSRATVLLLMSQGIAAGGAVLVNLLAARTIEPGPRGELALALQVSYLVTVIILMGLERPWAATQHGPFAEQLVKFVRLVIPAVGAMILIGVVWASLDALGSAQHAVLILCICAFAGLNAFSRGVRSAYISSRAWRPLVLNSIASQVVVIGFAIWFAAQGVRSPDLWMLAYIGSGTVPLLILLRAISTAGRRASVDRTEERALRLVGLKLLPGSFGNTALLRSERLLLPILASSAQLGLYVTVATVMEMAAWPVTQWVDASLRRWSQARVTKPSQVLTRLLRAAGATTLLAAALGGVSFGIVQWLLPAPYHGSTVLIVPLAIASIIYSWTRVQQGLLISNGAPGWVSVTEATGLVVSLLAYLLLIPHLGMMGAAIGSIIGYLACAVTGALFLRRQMRSADKPLRQPSDDAECAAGVDRPGRATP